MRTDLQIAFRYAILLSLLMLLWLSLEFMVGLHDNFADLHPYVTLLSISIPIFCCWRALREKRRAASGGLTFWEAFLPGFLLALFAAILAIPVQLIFHNLVNPDFFQSMTQYAVHHALAINKDPVIARAEAEKYFNLTSYIIQSVLGTFIVGTIIAAIFAWRTSSDK